MELSELLNSLEKSKKRDYKKFVKKIYNYRLDLISSIVDIPNLDHVVIEGRPYSSTIDISFKERYGKELNITDKRIKDTLINIFNLIVKCYTLPYGLFPASNIDNDDLIVRLIWDIKSNISGIEFKYNKSAIFQNLDITE